MNRTSFLICLFLILSVAAGAGALTVVTTNSFTFVRLTTSNSGAVDGDLDSARFYFPKGIAVDAEDNIYVADTGSRTIRKISPQGDVDTVAGQTGRPGTADGPGYAAPFNQPRALAVDQQGWLYVADTQNHTIRKIDKNGYVSTLAGHPELSGRVDGSKNEARFFLPSGIAVDRHGVVYVADTFNEALRKIMPNGTVTTLLNGIQITDLTVGANDELYMLIREGGFVSTSSGIGRLKADATLDLIATTGGFGSGIAVTSDGKVYVSVGGDGTIRRLKSGNELIIVAGGRGQWGSTDGKPGSFNSPGALATDSKGNLFVVDSVSSTIRKIDTNGVVTTFAGVANMRGDNETTFSRDSVRFRWPMGVAVDSQGTVYVADQSNMGITRMTVDGRVTVLPFGKTAYALAVGASNRLYFLNDNGRTLWVSQNLEAAAQLGRGFEAMGLAVDKSDNVYVADTGNFVVRRVTADGTVQTIAGREGQSGIDDGPREAARFSWPSGVVVDASGNLFVTDTFGHDVIRKVTLDGQVQTVAGSWKWSGWRQPNLWAVDGVGGEARFFDPSGIVVDKAGNFYIADAGSRTVRLMTPDYHVLTIGGLSGVTGSSDGTGQFARFGAPIGIALGPDDELYVADSSNQPVYVSSHAAPQNNTSWTIRVDRQSRLTGALLSLPITKSVNLKRSIVLEKASVPSLFNFCSFRPLNDSPANTGRESASRFCRRLRRGFESWKNGLQYRIAVEKES